MPATLLLLLRWLVATLAWLAVSSAQASDAQPLSADPALEARVMQIAEELRCLVCQNETIAASQADLAVDLRAQIRVRLARGEQAPDILAFMVDRYGEFVRYRPAFNRTNALLWIGPFLLLAVATLAGVQSVKLHRLRVRPALDATEQRRAAALLGTSGEAP